VIIRTRVGSPIVFKAVISTLAVVVVEVLACWRSPDIGSSSRLDGVPVYDHRPSRHNPQRETFAYFDCGFGSGEALSEGVEKEIDDERERMCF
jgi:hypothetical protein